MTGMSPLHISSENGHTKVVQLLLVKGSLLQRDHRGRTPLHCAASGGYTKTMHQLVLVHSHLLDQQDREGVSYDFSWEHSLYLIDVWNRIHHCTWVSWIIKKGQHLSSSPSTVKVSFLFMIYQLLQSLSLQSRKTIRAWHPLITLSSTNIPKWHWLWWCIPPGTFLSSSYCSYTNVLLVIRGEEIIRSETKKYQSLIEGLTINMPDVMMVGLTFNWLMKVFCICWSVSCIRIHRLYWIRASRNLMSRVKIAKHITWAKNGGIVTSTHVRVLCSTFTGEIRFQMSGKHFWERI